MIRMLSDMPGDKLPSPEDLAPDEIETILDPHVSGVPELSPINRLPRMIARWEERASSEQGEEGLVAKAELARCLAQTDPIRAKSLAEEVLTIAADNDWIRAQAEAYRAYAHMPWFFVGLDFSEHQNHTSSAVELFDYLQMDIRKAEVMLLHALGEYGHDGGARRAAAEIWEARQLAAETSEDEPLRQGILGMAAWMFAKVAWQSERAEDLARGYWAVAILHFRRSSFSRAVGLIHEDIAGLFVDKHNFGAAKPHLTRSMQVFHRNTMWNRCFLAEQKMAKLQLHEGDVDGARRSLARLKKMKLEKSITYNDFSVELVEGYIRLEEKKWAEAISLLEPLMSLNGAGRETLVGLLQNVSEAYTEIGNPIKAVEMLQRALQLQGRLYEDRLSARAGIFSLSDEIRKLQNQKKQNDTKAKRDDALLRAILPPTAYDELGESGSREARYYDNVGIFYSDFADFTEIANGIPPRYLMGVLSDIFDEFDRIMGDHGCERIEAIGDAYLAVSGLTPVDDAMPRIARAAIEIGISLDARNLRHRSLGVPQFVARTGLHCGSIIGGLVGNDRLRYAIFGDAVNTTQRLEAGCVPGEITISETAAELLRGTAEFSLRQRAPVHAKGKGPLRAWVLEGPTISCYTSLEENRLKRVDLR